MKTKYAVMIPYIDLAYGEPNTWVGGIEARSRKEAWCMVSKFCDDTRLLLKCNHPVDRTSSA